MSLVPETSEDPACVLLFSGKRKCGKDYITDALFERLGDGVCSIVKISGPIKEHWSKEKGISFHQLMSSHSMKEEHRKHMIDWSQQIRKNDPGYFCRAAILMYKANEKAIWIVSDVRRKSDINWFKDNYCEKVVTLRIVAEDNVRQKRGWTFTPGIDDEETECDLDDFSCWDKIIRNDGDTDTNLIIDNIIQLISSRNTVAQQLVNSVS